MPDTRPRLLFTVIVFLLCLPVASPVSAASQRARKHAAKQVQAAPPPQVPAGPLTQLTLEEIPSTPPQVTFHNNQLTIVAENSTLSDILHAVQKQTGAVVETPANAGERVVAHLGPGPARDVLASLLNGSHFDYVMLGSAENPTAVSHLILTAKSGEANEVPVQQANAAPPPPQPEQDVTQDLGGDDFATADEEPEAEIPADQQVQAEDQQQQQQQLPNGQIMRSPQQLLQELQQRQMMQQQQQQNGGQAPTPAAPQGFPIPPDQNAQPPQ